VAWPTNIFASSQDPWQIGILGTLNLKAPAGGLAVVQHCLQYGTKRIVTENADLPRVLGGGKNVRRPRHIGGQRPEISGHYLMGIGAVKLPGRGRDRQQNHGADDGAQE